MKNPGTSGQSLIAAILIIIIASMAGLTVVSLLGADSQGSLNYMYSQQAFFTAEAGIQYAAYLIHSGASYVSPIQKSFSNGSFSVTVAKQGNTYTLVSTGQVAGSQRVANYVLKAMPPFKYALFAGGSAGGTTNAINISRDSTTDSYDSSIGPYGAGGNAAQNGDIATNADIVLGSDVYIGGDASTGPDGDFNQQSKVAGTITHDTDITLSAVTVPSELAALPSGGEMDSTQTLDSGDYKFTQIDLTHSEVLTLNAAAAPIRIYLTDTNNNTISTSNSARVTVSASSAYPVIIYTAGGCEIGGDGVVNSTLIPGNFQLYSADTNGKITLSGSEDFYGLVYAPACNVVLSRDSELFGALTGDTIDIGRDAVVHRDENLVNVDSPVEGSEIVPQSWDEVY